MRDRHLPRLCRSCTGPMARQEDGCWRCGAPWAAEQRPPDLRLAAPAVLTIRAARLADGGRPATLDFDRWVTGGGRVGAPDRAVAPARSNGRRAAIRT